VTEHTPQVPLETRAANVADIDFAQRRIDIVAAPYEQPSQVPVLYRGELWEEIFERGAFDGIESREGRVSANRDHDRSRTVGKVLKFWPSREEGLVAEVKIGKTALGDETLALADEDMLSASTGFGVRGRHQVLNTRAMTRRIRKAFVDHLAFVEKPAYAGAQVLNVRGDGEPVSAADLPPLGATPDVDEYIAFLASLRRR
jgi:phage head maturation protease